MKVLFKIILNLFFIPLFWFFSYVIPKKNNLLLFGSYFGYRFIGNPKYFYLYLLNRKNSEFIPFWITRNKNIYKMLKSENKPVVYLYSFAGIWSILRANYLIIEAASQDITGRTFILGNFNIINLWHGTPLKDISLDSRKDQLLFHRIFCYFIKKEMKLYKFIISCSESSADNMKTALLNNNIKVIGYPRNDIFFNKNLIYNDYKQKLNLSIYNKILLYAPTFRDNVNEIIPFTEKNLLNLNELLKKKNYIFLVKNHPLSLFGKKIDILSLSNIKEISNEIDDIQELLLHIDILISDYSSIPFEFCLTNRPIILYCYDFDYYLKNCRKMYYNYFEEMPQAFAKNEEELFDLIDDFNWSTSSNYKDKYKFFTEKFNKYQDGMACDRLYELILKYIYK